MVVRGVNGWSAEDLSWAINEAFAKVAEGEFEPSDAQAVVDGIQVELQGLERYLDQLEDLNQHLAERVAMLEMTSRAQGSTTGMASPRPLPRRGPWWRSWTS